MSIVKVVSTPEELRTALLLKAREHMRIGDLLVAAKLVTPEVVQAALAAKAVGKSGRLGDILVGMGAVSREALDQVLAQQAGTLVLDIRAFPVNAAAIALLPGNAANLYQGLPVEVIDGTLVVAFGDLPSSDQLAGVRFAAGQPVQPIRASNPSLLKDLIGRYYANAASTTIRHAQMSREQYDAITATADTPAALLRKTVSHAIALGASDIHIRPHSDGSRRILFRVDGHLREMFALEKAKVAGFIRHLEIFSNIDSFNRIAPKEGRFSVDHDGRPVDMRVSIIASSQGESAVLRILDPARFPESLSHLSLPKTLIRSLSGVLMRPHGLLVATGPTGSGKTTTLYTLLKELQARNLHVVTAEDPVEYQLEGINQFETQDFAGLLPQLLRHDPDVVMVGELRDEKTVQMALNAALTGHLVLSSVHANDSASTVHRLLGLGAPLHLLVSSLSGIVSQRLVRMTCVSCAGHGCAECGRTGYLGRTLAAEMARPLPSLMTLQGMPAHADVRQHLEFVSGLTLDTSIVELAKAGKTTWQEAAGLVADPSLLPLAMRQALGYGGDVRAPQAKPEEGRAERSVVR